MTMHAIFKKANNVNKLCAPCQQWLVLRSKVSPRAYTHHLIAASSFCSPKLRQSKTTEQHAAVNCTSSHIICKHTRVFFPK